MRSCTVPCVHLAKSAGSILSFVDDFQVYRHDVPGMTSQSGFSHAPLSCEVAPSASVQQD